LVYFFSRRNTVFSEHDWTANVDKWLSTKSDVDYVKSLMVAVTEPGKIAGWVAPPKVGINRQDFSYEYVRKS
jgi:benzoyl-CoA 2,3-dioxygenase component B